MENKLQIIETPDYILAVSDNKKNDLTYCFDGEKILDVKNIAKLAPFLYSSEYKKIIAYQPKGDAPKLDLPLLPDFQQHILNVIKQK